MPRCGWGGLRRAALAVLAWVLLATVLGAPFGAASAAGAQTPPAAAPPALGATAAARVAKNVAIITIRTGPGGIDRWTAYSVVRRLREAEAAGADAVVFEIDTPGGEVGAVLAICDAIKSSQIKNTVAWVNPMAYSGGAIIALACREIVVADYASFGDAAPVQVSAVGGLQTLGATERAKIESIILAELVDSARRNGYDEKLVQGFATLGVELWLIENVRTGEKMFIGPEEYKTLFGTEPTRGTPRVPSPGRIGRSDPGPVPEPPPAPAGAPGQPQPDAPTPFIPAGRGISRQTVEQTAEALEARQSRSVRPVLTPADRPDWRLVEYATDGAGLVTLKTVDLVRYNLAVQTVNNDAQLKQFFSAENMSRLDPVWSEGVARFLTYLPVQGLLIIVFLVGLFIEFTHPGTVLGGTIAFVALALLLAPPVVVGMAAWWEVAAIVLGVALVALELFVLPGFGVFGVVGIVAIFGGLVGVMVPQGPGGLFPGNGDGGSVLYSVATVLISTVCSGVVMYFVAKHFGSLPVLNHLVLKTAAGPEDAAGLLAAMDEGPEAGASVGALGVVVSPLRPAGRISVGDRLLDVVCESGYVPAGASVRIVSISPFRIGVEPATPGPGGPDTPAPGRFA